MTYPRSHLNRSSVSIWFSLWVSDKKNWGLCIWTHYSARVCTIMILEGQNGIDVLECQMNIFCLYHALEDWLEKGLTLNSGVQGVRERRLTGVSGQCIRLHVHKSLPGGWTSSETSLADSVWIQHGQQSQGLGLLPIFSNPNNNWIPWYLFNANCSFLRMILMVWKHELVSEA